MFKNATFYRITGLLFLTEAAALAKAAQFAPCAPTQQISTGWVPPREAHGALIESVGGQWILKCAAEQRKVPAATVKAEVDRMAALVEQQTGRKPGRKERKSLQEEALLNLLPQAFPKRADTFVWINPTAGLLVIDSASASRVDQVLTLLVRTLDNVQITPLHTQRSAGTSMTSWLLGGEVDHAAFTIDRDCELRSADELKSVVRYARHPLDVEEVRQHIRQGMEATRVAMTWNGRVSFVLDDDMRLRKVELLDVTDTSKAEAADAFDADVTIITGGLSELLADLVEALGGEVVVKEGGAA